MRLKLANGLSAAARIALMRESESTAQSRTPWVIVRQCSPVSSSNQTSDSERVGSSRIEMFPMIASFSSSSRVHLATLLFVFPVSFSALCEGRMLPVSFSSPLL